MPHSGIAPPAAHFYVRRDWRPHRDRHRVDWLHEAGVQVLDGHPRRRTRKATCERLLCTLPWRCLDRQRNGHRQKRRSLAQGHLCQVWERCRAACGGARYMSILQPSPHNMTVVRTDGTIAPFSTAARARRTLPRSVARWQRPQCQCPEGA